MTRKIPKLKEKGWPAPETPAVEPKPIAQEPEPMFPEAANDATLEKIVRERAFAALEAKLVSAYGAIPDEIKDEIAEMRRSL